MRPDGRLHELSNMLGEVVDCSLFGTEGRNVLRLIAIDEHQDVISMSFLDHFQQALEYCFGSGQRCLGHSPMAERVGPFAIGKFGPRNIKWFGNPLAAMPRYDFGCPTHTSWRFNPSRPMIGKRGRNEVSKPVAQIIMSSK